MQDDSEILTLYKEGRQDYAFNLIMRKYSKRIYWHIRQMVNSHEEADDLTQDTFIKVWKYLPGFREDSNLYTWIYRIATNETVNFLRKEKFKNALSLSDGDKSVTEGLVADPYFNGDDIEKKLYYAIRKLPPKQRAVFNLRYFEEMKYDNMVEIFGGTVGSLKASYHHAYTKILEYLKEED